ncbi:hypothetical protein B9Z55_027794 [Caenorhabditis nigoni]|nr:hypothetical protein B9Z55_027794 [Caenorhabditis nigoni]
MARKNECEKAIRFISNSIKNYTEPESLERWCDLAKTEAGYDKCADSFSSVISYRLDRIEDLKGYSLMEKVRLVFLFSRPVSSAFVEELKDDKCTVELNDKRKITYFRSPDGDCVLQSEQDPNTITRKFKGKRIQPKTRPIRFIRNDDCEKAIKFILNGIKNCTEPENLLKWCELAKMEVGYDKRADSFSWVIKKRLDKIEGLKGYSLMEKVHLAYIFSRPVSPEFLRILKDAKCVVELNDKGKITYFRSEDRDIVLQSEHKKRNFKGNPFTETKKKADVKVRIPDNVQTQPPPASQQSLPNPPEIDDVEIANGGKGAAEEQEKQEIKATETKKEENNKKNTSSNLRSEEDVDVTTESIQQETPFNGRIDYDDMDDGEYPEFMVPDEIEPPMQHNKRHADLIQENPKRLKIDKPKEPEIANPPEENDVEARNEEEKAIGQAPRDSDDLGSIMNDNLNNQNQDARAGEQDNNYADLDIEEYPEFMVANDDETPNQHKRRQSEPSQGNPKRLKIDNPKEPEIANPPEVNDVETRNEEGEEAPEHILEDSEEPPIRVNNESDIQKEDDEEERDAALEQKPETFDDVGPTVNEILNIQARDHENNQNGVKIEDSQEGTEQEPEAWVPEAKAEMPELEKMSLLKLTEQIEALAFNINLEGCFQQKALRAVRLFEAKDQLILIQDFNQLFKIVLKNLKSGRLQNPTGSSMKLIRLFEHFKRSLIRPLGDELMADTLGILEDEIRKLGESTDEIPVKTIQTKLDSLMHLLTNTWADLDE